MKLPTYEDHKILDVLNTCKPTLDWIDSSQPVNPQGIPVEHVDNVKALEKLGIVFRRNNKTLEIAKQRLRRVIECESKSY